MANELEKIIPGDGAQESADKVYNNDALVKGFAQAAQDSANGAANIANLAKAKADSIIIESDTDVSESDTGGTLNQIWLTSGTTANPTGDTWKATVTPTFLKGGVEATYEGGLYGTNASIVLFKVSGGVLKSYVAGNGVFINTLKFTPTEDCYLQASFLVKGTYGSILPFRIVSKKNSLMTGLDNVVYRGQTDDRYSLSMRNNNTFVGAFNTVMDLIYAKNPRVRVTMITHNSESSLLGPYGHKGCIEIQKKIANYWGLGICDLANNLGWINRDGVNTLTPNVPDNVHPGTDTTMKSINNIAKYCTDFLKPIFGEDWTGKKVVWIGTSIPAGYPNNSDSNKRYPNIAVTTLGGVCNNLSQNSSSLRLHTTQGQWVTNKVTHSYLDETKTPNIWTVLDLFGTANEPDLIVIDHGYNDYNLDQSDSDVLLNSLKFL